MSANMITALLESSLLTHIKDLGLTVNISRINWQEAAKPTLTKGIVLVTLQQSAAIHDDYKHKSLGTGNLEDDVAVFCANHSINRGDIQVFPIYATHLPDITLSVDNKYSSNEVVGFAYADQDYDYDILSLNHHILIEHVKTPAIDIVDSLILDTLEWAKNNTYQAVISRGNKVLWNSGLIYRVNDWNELVNQYLILLGFEDAVTSSTAEVFVTTFTIFDNGETGDHGKWFNLKDYPNHDEFYAAATKYVNEELDSYEEEPQAGKLKPYYMDFNISFLEENDFHNNFDTDALIGDEKINPDLWCLLKLSDNDLIVVNAYYEAETQLSDSVEENCKAAKEKLIGRFDGLEDFGRHYVEKAGYLAQLPEHLITCFDYHEAGDILSESTIEYDGFYFQQ